jgi:BlaI family penicillinase repressor
MTARRRAKSIPKLSDLEWEIMKPLWEHGPMAARDIFDRVPEDFGWAYETVKTMLARLVKKGALTYDQVGNSFLYRPAFTRTEMAKVAAGSFLERVFDGGVSMLFASFMERATPDEIAELKLELARYDRETKKRKGIKK